MSSLTELPPFQLTGGHISLDFANTLDNRGRPGETDLLSRYRDMVAFAALTGIITAGEFQRTARVAEEHPSEAELVLGRGRKLREAIFTIFSAVATRQKPPLPALAELNSALRDAGAHRRVVSSEKDRFAWDWLREDNQLDWILWPIALAAAELLASDDVSLVRSCASETCNWLFLDRSKSHSRRWCDMKTCGNRNKARRFYLAKKKAVRS
jgi:predicted RNA-binding Zn ribbon-like protein